MNVAQFNDRQAVSLRLASVLVFFLSASCSSDATVTECTPNAFDCRGDERQVCDDLGNWITLETCDGRCTPDACLCEEGAFRCEDQVRQLCSAAGTWDTVETCADACSPEGCICSADFRCVGTERQACSAEGVWESIETCAEQCSPEGCICNSGDLRCVSAERQACNADGSWETVEMCAEGCTPESCICEGDYPLCDGESLITCAAGVLSFETCEHGCVGQACCSVTMYQKVTDDHELLSIEVPSTWVDRQGNQRPDETGLIEGASGPSVSASPNLQELFSDSLVPGVRVTISAKLAWSATIPEVLDTYGYEGCTASSEAAVTLGEHSGTEIVWSCAGYTWSIRVLAPENGAYFLIEEVKSVGQCEEAGVLQHLGDSLAVSAPPTGWPQEYLPPCHHGFTRRMDAYQVLSAEFPVEWTEAAAVNYQDLRLDPGILGPGMQVSPDVSEFGYDGTVPGLFIAVSEKLIGIFSESGFNATENPAEALARLRLNSCLASDPIAYPVAGYSGAAQAVVCGSASGGAVGYMQGIWWPEDQSYLLVVSIKMINTNVPERAHCDVEALSHILSTVQVAPVDTWDSALR